MLGYTWTMYWEDCQFVFYVLEEGENGMTKIEMYYVKPNNEKVFVDYDVIHGKKMETINDARSYVENWHNTNIEAIREGWCEKNKSQTN